MSSMMAFRLRSFRRRIQAQFGATDGSSTVEFVLWFPLFMTLFLGSFEISIYGMRSVMLERAVDMTVRDIRLGLGDLSSLDKLKESICSDSLMLGDCNQQLKLRVTTIDKTAWNFPSGSVPCFDELDQALNPLQAVNLGARGDLMLIRACVKKKPFFGSTGFTLGMPTDSSGEVTLVAVSTFLNEP